MTAVGQWRATYVPGDWLVLCGPASVVVLEPPGEGWTPLVAELWQQVLAARSMLDLAERLAVYGLDSMPSFGALFWTGEGMRSLVRGSVSVVDPATEQVVANGEGIQTWSEVGLGELRTVRIDTGSAAVPQTLQLPLVVGAVRASTLLLDAEEEARVRSPQLEPTDDEPDRSATEDEPTQPTEPMDPPTATTEALPEADTALLTVPPVAPELEPSPGPQPPPPGPTVEATVCPHGHPNPPGTRWCHDCGVGITDRRPRRVAQPVLALLRCSDGTEQPVDRTVLVGRAPAARVGVEARLLTVPSPDHDISRTHLQVTPEGWRILVTDLHSTNGTVLVPAGARSGHLLPPGEPVPVELGSVLELAEGVSVLVDSPR